MIFVKLWRMITYTKSDHSQSWKVYFFLSLNKTSEFDKIQNFSDVCPTLMFVFSDVCHSDVCLPYCFSLWRLSTLTFVSLTFVSLTFVLDLIFYVLIMHNKWLINTLYYFMVFCDWPKCVGGGKFRPITEYHNNSIKWVN